MNSTTRIPDYCDEDCTKEEFLEFVKQVKENAKKMHCELYYRVAPAKAEEYVKMSYQQKCPLVSSYPPSLPDVFQPLPIPENRDPLVRNRLIGMFLGQAVGDSVGLATEGLPKKHVEWCYGTERINYKNIFPDNHRVRWMTNDLVAGDWTDDTDQAILMLDSIIRNNGKIDIKDFAQRLYFWGAYGFPELGDIRGIGYGSTFITSITANGFLGDPITTAEKKWFKRQRAGNGALMRTCAILSCGWEDIDELVKNARTFASVTHADHRCLASVEILVRILVAILKGRKDVENFIKESVEYGKQSLEKKEDRRQLEMYIDPKSLEDLYLNVSMTFTFKPIGCTIWALRKVRDLIQSGMDNTKIFEDIITEIVKEGGDADTNAAVVGSVIGAYLSYNCIPEEWMQLRNLNWYYDRINRVLKLQQLPLI
ncbi:ADP-ribosylglycohydrolase [Entamoeba marina]